MIEAYFDALERNLRDFPVIRSYTLTKKPYNIYQGYVAGKVIFDNGFSLHFVEVMDVEIGRKLKYRYHCMDAGQELLFRYDNAPHHPEVETFPHHKHNLGNIEASREPSLDSVLLEILRIIQEESSG
jgi:hypothetical protein